MHKGDGGSGQLYKVKYRGLSVGGESPLFLGIFSYLKVPEIQNRQEQKDH